MHSQCTVQRAPTVIRVWHCGSVVWPRAQHHRGIAGGCAAGAGLTEPRNAPVELHARGVSRSLVALSSGLLGQHTDARQWRREHYIRNPYLHTCRVKISTFPWRPVSISARSSRLLLRLRLWDCADCGPQPHLPHSPASSAPICAETCNWASDADCDDGGPGLGSARPGPTACGRPDHRLIC